MTDVNEQGSETQSVETESPVVEERESLAPEFSVPEQYKDAGWAANIKSEEDVWNQLANAQKLIGKKTVGIPDENSSENDITEFYGKVRPENSTDYEFDLEEDTEFFQKLFYDNGLSKRQAKAIVEGYKESVRKQSEGLYSEAGLKENLVKYIGEDYQPKVTEISNFLKQYADKETLQNIDKLPNAEVGLIYGIINLVMDKYGVKELGSVSRHDTKSIEPDLKGYIEEKQKLDLRPHSIQEEADLKRKYNIGVQNV